MEKSPWKLIDKKFQAVKFVGADLNFALQDCGTSLPDAPVHDQVFALVDSLTVPTYVWTFRYNKGSISYKWEFLGGSFATIFGTDSDVSLDKLMETGWKSNGAPVYYKFGNAFPIPYVGEYEFTGGVVLSTEKKDVRISTQIIYNNLNGLSVAWPSVLNPGSKYIPFPLKRLTGLMPGKSALGIGSSAPSDTMVHWSTLVIRPIRIGVSL